MRSKKQIKIVSVIIAMSIVFSLSIMPQPVFGYNSENLDSSTKQILWNRYESYQLDFLNNSVVESTISSILENAPIINRVELKDCTYTSYDTHCLVSYLPQGCKIQNIEYDGTSVYVGYITDNNEGVMLKYVDDVLVERAISDWQTGVSYLFTKNGDVKRYTINNITYSLTEEQINTISDLLEKNDLNTINQMDGIIVDYSDSGDPFVRIDTNEINNVAAATSVKTYLPDVQEDFPKYSKSFIASSSQYCGSLGQNINISVYDSRYNYQQTSVSYTPFFIGIALTIISTTWSSGTTVALSVVKTVLGHIGAAFSIVSGVEQLMTDVKLANGGVVQYVGRRDGVVYDTTSYNTNVRVYSFPSNAEYHLVVTANYGAQWGMFGGEPLIFTTTPSTIIGSALSMYSQDIDEWGYCHSYYPYSQYIYN